MPRNTRVPAGQMRATTSLPMSSAGAAPATAASVPPLGLVGALSSVMVQRSTPDERVVLALGVNLVAGDRPLEIHVKRKSYQDPIVADQLIGRGARKRTRRLPAELLDGFNGLKDFIRLTLTDDSGQEVVDRNQTFCPTGSSVRARPDAPPTSPYPDLLDNTTFTLGTVWGLQAGWAIEVLDDEMDDIELPDGTHTARVRVNPPHCAFFDIPSSQAEVTIGVTVRTMENGEPPFPHDDDHEQGHTRSPAHAHAHAQRRSMLAPVAMVEAESGAKPAAGAGVPAGLRPDLRALPAWGIAVMDPEEPGEEGGQQLAFSADVWNAGPSPLVVDGFRRPGTKLMDAYQYFYDGDGEQVGFVHTGTLEFDEREGHQHWHFTDFARYRLLKADKQEAVRSGKEAFCLTPTHSIDLTVKGANWKPHSTGLTSACGEVTSLAIRETLDVGWGDTYDQSRPGQAFDLTGLPNGTYYIEITANPEGRLHERSRANNVSLRKVILGGRPGARTVQVPPHEGIDAP
jgi:hypothetical protein